MPASTRSTWARSARTTTASSTSTRARCCPTSTRRRAPRADPSPGGGALGDRAHHARPREAAAQHDGAADLAGLDLDVVHELAHEGEATAAVGARRRAPGAVVADRDADLRPGPLE